MSNETNVTHINVPIKSGNCSTSIVDWFNQSIWLWPRKNGSFNTNKLIAIIVNLIYFGEINQCALFALEKCQVPSNDQYSTIIHIRELIKCHITLGDRK